MRGGFMRGRVSYISKRYSKTLNMCLKHYDQKQKIKKCCTIRRK